MAAAAAAAAAAGALCSNVNVDTPKPPATYRTKGAEEIGASDPLLHYLLNFARTELDKADAVAVVPPPPARPSPPECK